MVHERYRDHQAVSTVSIRVHILMRITGLHMVVRSTRTLTARMQ